MADDGTETRRRRAPRVSPEQIVDRVRRVLDDLGGMDVERITGVQPDEDGDGWRVDVEVVEVRKVPDTTDILGRYEVLMSRGGQFRGYRQIGRRRRGDVEDGR